MAAADMLAAGAVASWESVGGAARSLLGGAGASKGPETHPFTSLTDHADAFSSVNVVVCFSLLAYYIYEWLVNKSCGWEVVYICFVDGISTWRTSRKFETEGSRQTYYYPLTDSD